jgi:hypothetical protein
VVLTFTSKHETESQPAGHLHGNTRKFIKLMQYVRNHLFTALQAEDLDMGVQSVAKAGKSSDGPQAETPKRGHPTKAQQAKVRLKGF